jgi:hypothetical protein
MHSSTPVRLPSVLLHCMFIISVITNAAGCNRSVRFAGLRRR